MIEIKIPDTIKIGGFDYKIRTDDEAARSLQASSLVGEHSAIELVLRLHPLQVPQQFSNTFIHEILHGVDRVYNGGSLTEQQSSVLANGLHQIFEQLGITFVKE